MSTNAGHESAFSLPGNTAVCKRVFSLVVGGSVFLAWTLPCLAGPPPTHWWQEPQVVETLALTPEQSHKIEALIEQSVERRKQGAKQIKEIRRSIAHLLSAPELDETQVLSTLTASSELGTKQRRDIVTMRIQVRQVLSTEQFRKLLELYPKIMQQRWVPRRIRVKGTRPPTAAEPAPQQP